MPKQARIINGALCQVQALRAEGFADDACHIVTDALARARARSLFGVISPLLILWSVLRWEHTLGRASLQSVIGDLYHLETAIDAAIEAVGQHRFTGIIDCALIESVVTRALHEARLLGRNYVGSEHIVLALFTEDCEHVSPVLLSFGVTKDDIYQYVRDIYSQ
jgi:ATP-dependent Clp protease ATP-binding subunit ClpA